MDGIYKLLVVLAAAVIACNAVPVTSSSSSRQGSFNRYFIYTLNNTRIPIEINQGNLTAAIAALDATKNTTVIVHGHRGSGTTSLNPIVKDAFLESEDIDVIVVDWSVYAAQSYTNAVGAVPSVGVYLANLITELAEVVSPESLHLVGFDLGAHVVGFTGRSLGNVARITGLNPSGSQWGANTQRLSKNDANYVEVIHTDGDGLLGNGIGTAIGHVDFFVNGGNKQPGCVLNNVCDHNRSWEVFAATLVYNHLVGNQCGSWLQVTLNNCRGRTLAMGNNEFNKLGSGMYRVNTRKKYPY